MINVIYKSDYNSLRKIFTIQLQDFLKRFLNWKRFSIYAERGLMILEDVSF